MARVPVYMPKFGMTMMEGLIVEWRYQEGDAVTEGDVLLVVETEKVNTDIEAPVSGRLVDIQYQVDDEVPVGEIIAYIDEN